MVKPRKPQGNQSSIAQCKKRVTCCPNVLKTASASIWKIYIRGKHWKLKCSSISVNKIPTLLCYYDLAVSDFCVLVSKLRTETKQNLLQLLCCCGPWPHAVIADRFRPFRTAKFGLSQWEKLQDVPKRMRNEGRELYERREFITLSTST